MVKLQTISICQIIVIKILLNYYVRDWNERIFIKFTEIAPIVVIDCSRQNDILIAACRYSLSTFTDQHNTMFIIV